MLMPSHEPRCCRLAWIMLLMQQQWPCSYLIIHLLPHGCCLHLHLHAVLMVSPAAAGAWWRPHSHAAGDHWCTPPWAATNSTTKQQTHTHAVETTMNVREEEGVEDGGIRLCRALQERYGKQW